MSVLETSAKRSAVMAVIVLAALAGAYVSVTGSRALAWVFLATGNLLGVGLAWNAVLRDRRDVRNDIQHGIRLGSYTGPVTEMMLTIGTLGIIGYVVWANAFFYGRVTLLEQIALNAIVIEAIVAKKMQLRMSNREFIRVLDRRNGGPTAVYAGWSHTTRERL